jgi:predicted metal-dependent HD superfamily phosphohydrolase
VDETTLVRPAGNGMRAQYWDDYLAAYHKAGAWEALRAGYEEPHRSYHSWRHIEHMIAGLEKYRPLAARFDLILAAIFWHDVVYMTRAPDGSARPDAHNVRDSADMFRRYAAMSAQDEADVVALIMGTSDHVGATASPHLESDLGLFLDLDLSSLAAPWAKFNGNSDAIRHEFDGTPEKDFLTGHIAVLDRFMRAVRLYRRDETRKVWEAKARKNLSRQILELERRLAAL